MILLVIEYTNQFVRINCTKSNENSVFCTINWIIHFLVFIINVTKNLFKKKYFKGSCVRTSKKNLISTLLHSKNKNVKFKPKLVEFDLVPRNHSSN